MKEVKVKQVKKQGNAKVKLDKWKPKPDEKKTYVLKGLAEMAAAGY